MVDLELVGDGFSTDQFLFEEEIIGQFIFIDFDEVDSGFGFAEAMMIFESMSGAFAQLLELRELLPRKAILSGNKLIVIHLLIIIKKTTFKKRIQQTAIV